MTHLEIIDGSELSQVFYKITNKKENHHGFQYCDGLNILTESFNDDQYASCCEGGFYFTDIEHILEYVSYGCYIREITLPLSDPVFKIIKVKDRQRNEWRANKIILGKKHDLWTIETFKMIFEKKNGNDTPPPEALRMASELGHTEIVKILVENGADVHAYNGGPLRWASRSGHLEIVKYLVEKGAHVNAYYSMAFQWAAELGHIETVKYLIEKGANVHGWCQEAIIAAWKNGHTGVVNLLGKILLDIDKKLK